LLPIDRGVALSLYFLPMKSSRLLALLFLCLAAATAFAQNDQTTPATITAMLQDFLAHNSDPAQHDRFWADDLVYTSSAGAVKTKAEIMQSFAADKAAHAQPRPPAETYSAEDIVVRPYGTTAALTFRLVRHTADGKLVPYRNSGTLLFRQGQWQVVTWQATLVPATAAKP
jgi:Domain of unknown function (DUF4440)